MTCADCHGGDPSATTIDGAMSPEAGYIGAPAREDIPALCASCHADVNQMRQYDLPTDQYAQYQESTHGKLLAEGDPNVATCYDCHGGHQILKANDPGLNGLSGERPATCANCHADETLMAPYRHSDGPVRRCTVRASTATHCWMNKIFVRQTVPPVMAPTAQRPQDLKRLPTFVVVATPATQDYYLQSPHADVHGEDAPKCVTCHGRYDVSQPSEAMYEGSEPRHCGSCHTPESPGGQMAQTFYDAINSAANPTMRQKWQSRQPKMSA